MNHKNNFFVYAFLFALTGCATPRVVVVPGTGEKLTPSATFISGEEMLKKGKNPYGIPPTSFAFYPEGYKPDEKDVFEVSKIDFERRMKELEKHNKFVPMNAPGWDDSYNDPKSIRHDCFVPERLFVIPWGWKRGEVGLREKDLGKKSAGGNQDFRVLPDVYGCVGNKILVWDSRNNKKMFYRLNGVLEEEQESDQGPESKGNDLDFKNTCWTEGYGSYAKTGDQKYHVAVGEGFNGGPIMLVLFKDLEKGWFKDKECVAYIPMPDPVEWKAKGIYFGNPGRQDWYKRVLPRAMDDCSGYIFQYPSEQGVKIYFYRYK